MRVSRGMCARYGVLSTPSVVHMGVANFSVSKTLAKNCTKKKKTNLFTVSTLSANFCACRFVESAEEKIGYEFVVRAKLVIFSVHISQVHPHIRSTVHLVAALENSLRRLV